MRFDLLIRSIYAIPMKRPVAAYLDLSKEPLLGRGPGGGVGSIARGGGRGGPRGSRLCRRSALTRRSTALLPDDQEEKLTTIAAVPRRRRRTGRFAPPSALRRTTPKMSPP